jgi:hypothetical protein
MGRRIAISRSDVPYLTKERVQEEASLLLAEHAARCGRPVTIPVPVEDILEFHLQLVFEMADMKRMFGFGDVLGALWINEKTVRVDSSLDPSANPKMLGRFHFTLAHEAGHWRLHRKYFLDNPDQGLLFGAEGKPACVCRSSEAKKPIEWQADYFAAHLLMPSDLLRSGWQAWRGNLDAVCLEDLWADYGEETIRSEVGQRSDADRADQFTAASAVMEMFIRPLATTFEVSAEALRIRLEEAGLLLRHRSESLL